MRRIVLSLAVLVAAGVLVGSVGAAGTDNPNAPACADIIGGVGAYDAAAGLVDVRLTLLEPSCRNVVYAVFVYFDSGDTGVVGGQGRRGDGGVDENGDAILEFRGIRAAGETDGIVHVCAVSHRRGALYDAAGFDASFACSNGIELTADTPGGISDWD